VEERWITKAELSVPKRKELGEFMYND